MKEKTTRNNYSWSWLFFSLFLGDALGFFWVTENHLEGFVNGSWAWPFLAPAVLTALFLPLVGALADRLDMVGWLTALFGGALLLLLGLKALVPLPYALYTPLFTVLFLLALGHHLAVLIPANYKDKASLPGKGLALCLGALVVAWLADRMTGDAPFPTLGLMLLGLLALTCLGLFTLSVLERNKRSLDNPREAVLTELQTFPNSVGSYRDTRLLLFFLLFFSAASAELMFVVWTRLSGWENGAAPETSPVIFLCLALWGGFSAGRMIRLFGVKRLLVLSALLAGLLVLGLNVSAVSGEIALMILGCAFILGLVYGTASGLAVQMAPSSQAGQFAGYCFSALVLGVGLGKLFHIWHQPDQFPLLNLVLCIAALVCAVRLSPGRAIRLSKPPEEQSVEDPRDVEWDWLDTNPEGLAANNIFSTFTRFLARTFAEIFFADLRITGRENLVGGRGAILVANHPNTFIDPLLITALSPNRLHYWAKSTLWKMPMAGSILDRLGAMPVYRRQDNHGKSASNNKTMDIAAEKLNDGATVLIFPEGVSEVGLSLKPLKTGAARLGFQAIEQIGWSEDVPIIPIGIDYAEPSLFRSAVTLRIGEPIRLLEYHDAYLNDARTTVGEVTSELTSRMKNLLPHLDEPELEDLVHQVHDLYGERILQILDQEDETSARKAIAEAVNHYQKMDPDTVYLFNQRLKTYHREREKLATPENHPPIPTKELLKILASMFSFASFGLFTNWLPYRLTGRTVELFRSSPVWLATAKLGFGTVVFGLYYLLLGALINHFAGPMIAGCLLLCVAVSAFMALGAMERFAFRFRQLRTLWHAFWTQDTNDDIEAMKLSLIQDLERFRETYSFYKARETETW